MLSQAGICVSRFCLNVKHLVLLMCVLLAEDLLLSYNHMSCSLQIVRLSSQDVPTAYAFELEAATIVQPEEVAAAVQRVVAGAPVLA